jgi:Subtilase family
LQAEVDFVDDERFGHAEKFTELAEIKQIFRDGFGFFCRMDYVFRDQLMRKILFPFLLFAMVARAQSVLDETGVTALRMLTTNLDGSSIRVAQPEANTDGNTNDPSAFEVNPAAVSLSTNLLTYYSDRGSATVFTNAIGKESGHADSVASLFYGQPNGAATNVVHVDNYDADFFVNYYVVSNLDALDDAIVNQSFTFGSLSVTDQQAVDSAYDDYEETYGTLFVSAVNNGGNVCAPGTAYNSIGVAAYGGSSSIGPTIDNGRCKPDITAPAGATSFSTPQVSGAAALLLEAALRGDGGSDTNSAADIRTIKALLLNGAVKPANWTNSNSSPLDARYGAGVVNVLNSYKQLAGGKQSVIFSNTVSLNAAHPPTGATGTVNALSGWNFATNTSSATTDSIHHYYFNISNSTAAAKFSATATLVWHRQYNKSSINNLNLYLHNCANSNLVLCSTSSVDNIEHLWTTNLAQGRYDLQVLKKGGSYVSSAEPYALAWEFVPPPILGFSNGTNAALSWPLYPAGFLVEARTNLSSGSWSTNNLPAAFITNSMNTLPLNATNAAQFFRLRKPNF